MNKIIVISLMSVLGLSFCFGQERTSLDESIEALNSVIEEREASLDLQKKDKDKVVALNNLVEDYARLAKIWEERYNDIVSSIQKYIPLDVLFSESDSVFTSDLPDVSIVPTSLIPHYNQLKKISSIQKDIQALEKRIEDMTSSCIGINQDPGVVIPPLISDDVDSLCSEIKEVMNSGFSTFSEVQEKYFIVNIKDKYNSFIKKYFSND